MPLPKSVRTYYQLTKPGIIYGNVMVATGGFLLASKGHIDSWLLLATLVGMSLVIGSACVVNNYIDRDIDKKMARTRRRALVRGDISARNALIYAAVLGLIGSTLLIMYTNLLTFGLGLLGYLVYVVVYGIAKRRTVHSTLIGSISGALPPVAGYTAVTGRLDEGAILLFLVLTAWQMPHFYAIAIYRSGDYSAAGIPVLSVVAGNLAAKRQIMVYILGFIVVTTLLTLLNITGSAYLVVMLILGALWLRLGYKDFAKHEVSLSWARKMFFFSLVVLVTFSLMISVDNLLP